LFSISFSGVKVEMDQAPVKSPLPVPGGEPPSTLYQAPTEPIVFAPYVEPVDLKQQQIDSLTEQLSTLANQFSAYIKAVHGTQQ
jgi:hypothetical protein